MAFDLINYIYDQSLQQHRGLLAEYSKVEKYDYLKHIISLQLLTLKDNFKADANVTYNTITTQNSLKLHQDSLSILQTTPRFQQFFTPIQTKLSELNQKVAQTLFAEIQQLDQNAYLGVDGVQELIFAQQEWIIDLVDDWFWDAIQQPEHKLTKNNKIHKTDFKEIVKEFNQVMQQKNEFIEYKSHANTSDLESKHHQIKPIYQLLNPIVALVILYYLYNVIL